MKKILSLILTFSLALTCIITAKQIPIESHEEDIIITNLDWSEIGASDVVIIFNKNTEETTRMISNQEPSVRLSYYMENVGEVYFERIGDIGYYYENGEFITEIVYNASRPTTGETEE